MGYGYANYSNDTLPPCWALGTGTGTTFLHPGTFSSVMIIRAQGLDGTVTGPVRMGFEIGAEFASEGLRCGKSLGNHSS
ncbi:GL20942 [Drosophila persimilis]|uniref:GL20942 n=1 Tax=Drosophila persimilis TaxID=7234 RepID=B4H996_DROPE|nr:GL20942 [Drosophila persimilis]